MRAKGKDTVVIKGISLKPDPKSKKGTYIGTYRIKGKAYNVGCGTDDLHEAFLVADEKRKAKEAALEGIEDTTPVTLNGLHTAFLKYLEDEDKSERDLKAYRTTYNRLVGQRIDNITGEIRYQDRKGNDIPVLCGSGDLVHLLTTEQYEEWFKKTSKLLSDSSMRNHIVRIAAMFDWAKVKKYAVPDIDFRALYSSVLDDAHKSRDFTEEEVDKMLDYLRGSRHQHNYYRFVMLLGTGLRLGEVCTLKKNALNLVERELKVVRTKKKKKISVAIALPEWVCDEMAVWLKMIQKDNSEWLFPNGDGGHWGVQSSWFKKACIKLGINSNGPLEKIVVHSTRSRYISRQIEAGVPLPMVQQTVGHNFYDTTLRYSRLNPQKSSRQAADIMDAIEEERKKVRAEYEETISEMQRTIDRLKGF